MTGPLECSKVLPCIDLDHWRQVTFLGPRDEWCKVAGKYKYLYEMDTETAYNWVRVWVGAKHPSFEGCTIDTSKNVHLQINCVTDQIVQEAIATDDPHIMGVSAVRVKRMQKEQAMLITSLLLHIQSTLHYYQSRH
jgi:hypothetical protein